MIAGITVNFALGENGLIQKSKLSVSKYKEVQQNELENMEETAEELQERRIPKEFQEVEYIRSKNEKEGILTELSCSDIKKVTLVMRYVSNTDKYGAGFIMAATSDNKHASPFGLVQLDVSSYMINGIWGWNATSTVEDYNDYKKVTLEISKQYSGNAYLKLLTWVDQRNELWDLYSAIVYNENNEIIFNAIPCIEYKTGLYGVFDIVTSKFYKIQ